MAHRPTTHTLALAAAATATVATSLLLHRAVSKYGFRGFMRLLWEGDHLLPHIREAMDTLDKLESVTIPLEQNKMERIEISIAMARLNSVDGPTNHTLSPEDKDEPDDIDGAQILEQCPQLKKDLGIISHRLDEIAADVDSVRSGGDAAVKRRKKHLSKIIVGMMDQADALIVSLRLPC